MTVAESCIDQSGTGAGCTDNYIPRNVNTSKALFLCNVLRSHWFLDKAFGITYLTQERMLEYHEYNPKLYGRNDTMNRLVNNNSTTSMHPLVSINITTLSPHPTMMTSSNKNILRVAGLLCGDFIDHRLITLTKASDAELWYFFYLCLNNRDTIDLWRRSSYNDITLLPGTCSFGWVYTVTQVDYGHSPADPCILCWNPRP